MTLHSNVDLVTLAVTEAAQCRMVSRDVQSVGQDVQGNASPMHECLARPLNRPSLTMKVGFENIKVMSCRSTDKMRLRIIS